jgi:hypothetical protein
MAVNQSYAVGWIIERLDWECTLADLHVRARLADNRATAPHRRRPRRSRRHAPARSPVRGMSPSAHARKLRA